jgi:crotonobetainyl-CoA:carnitine CoA-transferase CaiB-like acyl-CoA transferase
MLPDDLQGFRILDLAEEPGFLAGRLLGDLGADVVKVEPPGGHAMRRRPPFWNGVEDSERSLGWLAQNTGKRGITLDLEKPRGRELLLRLCERADAVLETARPGSLDALGIGYRAMAERNPRIVVCSITPFGQQGPRRDWRASDLTALATGGNLFPTGDPDRAPVRSTLPTSYFHAGIEAALAITFALYGRDGIGRGQHIDVSLQEAMLMPNMSTPAQFPITGFKGGRNGPGYRVGRMFQPEIWRCRDGFVSFALRGGAARIPGLVAIVRYMDEHGMAPPCLKDRDWKSYNHNLLTQEEVNAMQAAFSAFFATKTKGELYRAALERKLMLAPINDAAAILASEQLAAREFFADIDYPHLGGMLRHPGAVAKFTPRGSRPIRGAPRIGEHNREILAEIGLDDAQIAILRADGVV